VLVRWLTLVSILCVSLARAEPLPQPLSPALLAKNAASLMPTDGMRDHVFRDREAIGATLSIRSEHPGKPVLQVDVPRGSRSADAVELLWNTGKDIVQGDVGLLRLQVRTLKARQESGESEVKIMFQRNHTPWEKSLITQFSFGPDWTLIEIPFVAVPQSSVEVDATVKPALADYAPSGTAPREAQDAPGAAPFATVGKHRRPVWSGAADECRLLHPGCRAPAFRRLCAVRLRCARIPGSPRCLRVHPDHAAGVDHSRGPRSIRHSRPRAELVPDSRVEHLNATARLRAGHGAFSTRSAVATTL